LHGECGGGAVESSASPFQRRYQRPLEWAALEWAVSVTARSFDTTTRIFPDCFRRFECVHLIASVQSVHDLTFLLVGHSYSKV
jgi:hypothetical protein